MTARSIGLFVALGAPALAFCGMLAAFQPSHELGRGGFIVGSLRWGVAFDDFHPDRGDIAGALVGLAGAGIIMYAR